ncbi:hypothetical protein BC936DRAFT_139204 [Jimgerdemannia flammicorona]|uniref:Uncharacterized protein n=1 Tax=Jimgerdemannia flammicorona TaxID=994334 RepID=A0A433DHT1_9FUNG|nr:hypothetical protein BC936DRAFT_139204 [Jimgerdemannia flammicorona]
MHLDTAATAPSSAQAAVRRRLSPSSTGPLPRLNIGCSRCLWQLCRWGRPTRTNRARDAGEGCQWRVLMLLDVRLVGLIETLIRKTHMIYSVVIAEPSLRIPVSRVQDPT